MSVAAAQNEKQSVVLLVEDYPDTRSTMAMLLAMSGFIVDEAGDGFEALEKMMKRKPDLILTDLRMPNMDGLEFSRLVKSTETYKHIPIILISATPPAGEQRSADISAFIQKPAPIADVLSVIAKHL